MRPSIILPTGEGDGEQAGSEEVDTGESEVMTEFVSEEEHKQEPQGVHVCLCCVEGWQGHWFFVHLPRCSNMAQTRASVAT